MYRTRPKQNYMKPNTKHRLKPIIPYGILVAVLLLLFFPRPLSRQLRGVCHIECESQYAIPLPGGDTLRLLLWPPDADPMRCGGADSAECAAISVPCCRMAADSARLTGNATGFFVAPDGHAITSAALIHGLPISLRGESLQKALARKTGRLEELKAALEHQAQELDYYHERHSVTDEGYTAVEHRRERVRKRLERVNSLLDSCRMAMQAEGETTATLECRLTVDFRERLVSGQVVSHRFPARLCEADGGLLLLQAEGEALPEGASRFCPYWLPADSWTPRFAARRILGFPLADKTPELPEGIFPDVLPADTALQGLWPEGAPVANAFGHLTGMVAGGRIVSGKAINRILSKESAYPRRVVSNIASGIRNFFIAPDEDKRLTSRAADSLKPNIRAFWLTDSTVRKAPRPGGTYAGQWKDSLPEGTGIMRYTDGSLHRGHWKGGMRWGQGTTVAPDGTSYTGLWEADSLHEGLRSDSAGWYAGTFDRQLRSQGYGIRRWWNEDRYEGEWDGGLRQGFGFFVGQADVVKCGTWKRDRFSGEEMDFTPNRIYGIDISRYQHESGRKKYKIDWNKLRITRLGASGKKAARGTVDYPVSFVYIKATQGTKIKSAYYADDAAAARKRGIPVGAYHFFSPKSGREQANYFLKMAAPRCGDLPPMLDVELTDAQIASMGGATAMFREMKIWMQVVEASCGVKPVLYVGQNFVNRYLSAAPPEWKSYDTWVARYGEYKPYVHLLYWQLSPNGRVAGIRGAVDINVFNGTPDQFNEYTSKHRVR